MAGRWRASTRLVLGTLMSALTALAQERTTASDAPGTALKADEPPLRFDRRPEASAAPAPAPVHGHWAPYASAVFSRFQALLTGDSELADRNLDLAVEIWIGPEGRIARARLVGSSGDRAVDARLRDKVLAHLTLPPPPKDMPMPVKVGVKGRHDR